MGKEYVDNCLQELYGHPKTKKGISPLMRLLKNSGTASLQGGSSAN